MILPSIDSAALRRLPSSYITWQSQSNGISTLACFHISNTTGRTSMLEPRDIEVYTVISCIDSRYKAHCGKALCRTPFTTPIQCSKQKYITLSSTRELDFQETFKHALHHHAVNKQTLNPTTRPTTHNLAQSHNTPRIPITTQHISPTSKYRPNTPQNPSPSPKPQPLTDAKNVLAYPQNLHPLRNAHLHTHPLLHNLVPDRAAQPAHNLAVLGRDHELSEFGD